MKQFLTIVISICFFSCSDKIVFVLKDKEEKYFLNDKINTVVKEGKITKSPIIVIDGILFQYDEKLDTVKLPLTKKDVYLLTFLNQKTADVIYGEIGKRGAVLISTKPNPN